MILDLFQKILDSLGLGGASAWQSRLLLFVVILLLAWLIQFVVRRVVTRAFGSVAGRTTTLWDDLLLEYGVFERLSLLAPALLLFATAGLLFPHDNQEALRLWTQRGANIWIILIGTQVLMLFFDAIGAWALERPATRDKPIRSYVQVAKLLVTIAAVVLAIAVVMGKSPLTLLAGLGALTAVLLLVFRESILGLIASIEIASYDLVRVGEWIEVPAYDADGDVLDISLHTIRIQNWDKTIVSLPTTALLEKGFKNWRGMSESGGRRIKRSLSIDMSSVRFLDDPELERLSRVEMLEPYLARKSEELKAWNSGVRSGDVLRRRRLTNLGTFRAYLEEFLRNHPDISQEHTFLVRQLPPGSEGLPIEIYVFSLDQRWAHYEAITADIFDHLLAVLPEFDLRVFQKPAGADVLGAFSGHSRQETE